MKHERLPPLRRRRCWRCCALAFGGCSALLPRVPRRRRSMRSTRRRRSGRRPLRAAAPAASAPTLVVARAAGRGGLRHPAHRLPAPRAPAGVLRADRVGRHAGAHARAAARRGARAAGRLRAVVGAPGPALGDLRLDTTIVRLQQDFTSRAQPRALHAARHAGRRRHAPRASRCASSTPASLGQRGRLWRRGRRAPRRAAAAAGAGAVLRRRRARLARAALRFTVATEPTDVQIAPLRAHRPRRACWALLLLLAAALFLLLDTDVYKSRLERIASQALGLELSIAGRPAIDVFPGLQLTLDDVHLRRQGKEIASARQAKVGIDLELAVRRRAARREDRADAAGHHGVARARRPLRLRAAAPAAAADGRRAGAGLARRVADGRLASCFVDQRHGKGFEARDCQGELHRPAACRRPARGLPARSHVHRRARLRADPQGRLSRCST